MGQELGKHRNTKQDTAQREQDISQRESPAAEKPPATSAASPEDVFISETAGPGSRGAAAASGQSGQVAGHSSPESSLSPDRVTAAGSQRRSSVQRWMLAAARVREGSFHQEPRAGGDSRKMSADTSWDKWDPELTVKMIRVPSVQNYGKIRRVLQLADR